MSRIADVCIVGMGAAGGILAKQLGSAGMDVVVLERGAFQSYADYAHKDSIRAVARRALEPTVNAKPLLFREGPGEPLRPLLSSNPTNAVGGALTFWTGMAARFAPGDFRVRSTDIEGGAAQRAGADLAGYDITDWPIAYEDLEPHYERFEWEFGVSGDDRANPFAPPRRRAYPLPPLQEGPCNALFAAATRRLGYHPYPNPNGILSKPYRPPARYDARIAQRKACTYCAHCHDYGCHVHAKAATLYTVIPVALQTGRVRLQTGCKVVRVNLDAKGRARSVSYRDRHEKLREQRARVVILAGYVFENTRLLLVSRTASGPHRRGLGNCGDQVGRCVMAHRDIVVMGVFEDRMLNGFVGPLTAGQRIDDLYGNNFDHAGLGFIRGGGLSAAGGGTPLDRFPFVPPGVPRWGEAYKEFLAKYYNRSFGISIQPETLPHPDNRITLHATRRDRRGLPVPVITFRLHTNEQRLQRFLTAAGEQIMRATGDGRRALLEPAGPGALPVGWRHPHGTGPARLGGGCRVPGARHRQPVGDRRFGISDDHLVPGDRDVGRARVSSRRNHRSRGARVRSAVAEPCLGFTRAQTGPTEAAESPPIAALRPCPEADVAPPERPFGDKSSLARGRLRFLTR